MLDLQGKRAHTLVVITWNVQALRREVELILGHGLGSFHNLLFDRADLRSTVAAIVGGVCDCCARGVLALVPPYFQHCSRIRVSAFERPLCSSNSYSLRLCYYKLRCNKHKNYLPFRNSGEVWWVRQRARKRP